MLSADDTRVEGGRERRAVTSGQDERPDRRRARLVNDAGLVVILGAVMHGDGESPRVGLKEGRLVIDGKDLPDWTVAESRRSIG